MHEACRDRVRTAVLSCSPMPRYLYGKWGRGGSWGATLRPATDACRTVDASDADSIGTLLWEAYRGTIDYRDETLDEMKTEAREFFATKYGPPLPDACVVREIDGRRSRRRCFATGTNRTRSSAARSSPTRSCTPSFVAKATASPSSTRPSGGLPPRSGGASTRSSPRATCPRNSCSRGSDSHACPCETAPRRARGAR